jgi:putative heme-binding domain-containing protein
VPNTLQNEWKTFPPAVRAEAVNTLSSRKEWAKRLLKAMDAKLIDRTAVTDNTVIKMLAFNDKELNDLIEKAWGRVRKTPDELNKLIDKTRAGLNAAPASFARGKKVFEAQCAKCHKFDGNGVEVGPQLDGAARDIEYMLANVIDPNRVIGAPYFLRTLNTLDGQAIQGLLAEEDAITLTLKVEGAKLVRIPKKEIDGEVKVQEKSMMPEGLTSGMTEQNFRDLLRYVMANPYLTDVTVNDKPVSAGVTGAIPLPAGKGVTVKAEFTAEEAFGTKLLIESADEVVVALDGAVLGKVKGEAGALNIKLPKGSHTLTLTRPADAKEGRLFVRFLDPNRKLGYPEPK